MRWRHHQRAPLEQLRSLTQWILCALTIVASHATSASNVRFERLSVADGLPHSTVWDITQDQTGYVWFATTSGLSRYDGYTAQNFYHSETDLNTPSGNHITALHVDARGDLWIGTFANGLNRYRKGNFDHWRHVQSDTTSLASNRVTDITSSQNQLWVASDRGVSVKTFEQNQFVRTDLVEATKDPGVAKVHTIYQLDNRTMLAGTDAGVVAIDINTLTPRKLAIPLPETSPRVLSLTAVADQLYIGTQEQLYRYNLSTHEVTVVSDRFKDVEIHNLVNHDNELWVGSFRQGVFRIRQDGSIEQFQNDERVSTTISENISLALFIDDHENLWSGSFGSGANRTYLPWQVFSALPPALSHDNCAIGGEIRSVYAAPNGDLWYSSSQRYRHYDAVTHHCYTYETPVNEVNPSYYFRVHQTYSDSTGQKWAATTFGLYKVSQEPRELIPVSIGPGKPIILSIKELQPNRLVLGTTQGVYLLDTTDLSSRKVSDTDAEPADLSTAFISTMLQSDDSFFLATDRGLAKLEHGVISPWLHDASGGLLRNRVMDVIEIDTDFLIALENGSLYRIDQNGTVQQHYSLDHHPVRPRTMMLSDDQNYVWVSSSNGLFRINLNDDSVRKFGISDGLPNTVFVPGAAARGPDGKFYFGTQRGLIAFYPDDIDVDKVTPTVVLSKLTRFNDEVVPGKDYDGLSISQPIEHLNEIELSHRDSVIGFELTAIHHAAPAHNQYAYRLVGLHSDWQTADATGRKIVFSKLSPGRYQLQAKAANKDNVWRENPQTLLSLRVKPAPWLSAWAFALYTLLIIAGLLWLIQARTRAAKKRAAELELEVAQRTEEINQQRAVIEDLLARKDELFANLTHELRTPLTLIMGPLEDELIAIDAPKDPARFELMRRNANRLLSMVEQILRLTELQNETSPAKSAQSVRPVLEAVVNSFVTVANAKAITLTLDASQDCAILASRDALEIIVGNLVSNALKYTPENGNVGVALRVDGDTLSIIVHDDGIGIPVKDQRAIFERFVRVGAHPDISGTGLGLSIVKELVDAHRGDIKVSSDPNSGTEFTVTLPITLDTIIKDDAQLEAISHLMPCGVCPPLPPSDQTDSSKAQTTSNDSILIIEDHSDMTSYIRSSLQPNYDFLTADNGEAGIELAVQEIPDLIICDLMMPGIDGFEVVNRLRDDPSTCHIPIIMLTARGDRESRMRGWNENVDEYMTKPFDATELKTRVGNILAVRNILRQQLYIEFQQSQLDTLPSITSRDQKFLDKLETVVTANYMDPRFNRTCMASAMAVSERQLQRKLKALLNINPMDYLRDYRLKTSSTMLAQGKQIAIVADHCGFSAPSHFTRCFKAKYGIAPKQYQQQATTR